MIKKLYFLFMVIFLGIALSAGSALAEDLPRIPLMCGQHDDVGDVIVSNDESNIYVKFVVTDDSVCLVETHVHVAGSLDGIPQKKGNPPPGQFEYSDTHGCVTEYTYTIPLDDDWVVGKKLYVAAHASTSIPETMSFTDVSLNKTFTIPGYPYAGDLVMPVNNGYNASLNDNPLGSDDLTFASESSESYDLGGYLLKGDNTFIFKPDEDPIGLNYTVNINYYLDGETCWGAGEDFPGKNWATYFTYTVVEESPGEPT